MLANWWVNEWMQGKQCLKRVRSAEHGAVSHALHFAGPGGPFSRWVAVHGLRPWPGAGGLRAKASEEGFLTIWWGRARRP